MKTRRDSPEFEVWKSVSAEERRETVKTKGVVWWRQKVRSEVGWERNVFCGGGW